MKTIALAFTLLLSLASTPSFSAEAGYVESLQMPAWLERNNTKQALRAGTELQTGDIVITGKEARLLIRLEEGSTVKLGENGQLDLNTLTPPATPTGVFEGFMEVIRGAFRFTTTLISKSRQRNIDVRIGAITAGIRGTDIWGSSGNDKDLLCLIEGDITAQRDGEPTFNMDKPLTYFEAPKNAISTPVKTVDTKILTDWAQQTELVTAGGTVSADGIWAANLISLQSLEAAEKSRERFEEKGYATDIQTIMIDGIPWYRLRIEGFISREDAEAFANQFAREMNTQAPWVNSL